MFIRFISIFVFASSMCLAADKPNIKASTTTNPSKTIKEAPPSSAPKTATTENVCKAAVGQKECDLKNKPELETAINGMKMQCKAKFEARCKGLADSMKPEDRDKKLATCSLTEVCSSETLADQMLEGCKEAFMKYGQESFENFKKAAEEISKSVACNSDMSAKRKLIEDYKKTVPPFLQKKQMPEQQLSNMNCSEITRVLVGFTDNTVKVLDAKLKAFEMQNPQKRGNYALYPPELAQFREWMDANGAKQTAALQNAMKGIANLPEKIQGTINQLQIEDYCYSNKTKAEMLCYAGIVVVEQAVGTVVTAGAGMLTAKAFSYLGKIAEISGSSKVAANVAQIQKQKQMAIQEATVKKPNALDNIIDKQKEIYASSRAQAVKTQELERAKENIASRRAFAEQEKADRRAEKLATVEARAAAEKPKAARAPASSSPPPLARTKLEFKPEPNKTPQRKYAMNPKEALDRVGAQNWDSSFRPDSQLMLAKDARKMAVRQLGGKNDVAAKVTLDSSLDRLSDLAEKVSKNGDSKLKESITQEKSNLLMARHLKGKSVDQASISELQEMKEHLAKKVTSEKVPPALEAEKRMLNQVQNKIEEKQKNEMRRVAAENEARKAQEQELREAQTREAQRAQAQQEAQARQAQEQEARIRQEQETMARRAQEQQSRSSQEQVQSSRGVDSETARSSSSSSSSSSASNSSSAKPSLEKRREAMEEARKQYKAGLAKKETDYRNSSSAPKEAKPFDASMRADLEDLIQKLERDPTSLSPSEVSKLQSLQKDIDKRKNFKDSKNGYYGLMEDDLALARKLEVSVDQASENLRRKQGSLVYEAHSQGRALAPPKDANHKISTKSHWPDQKEQVHDTLRAVQPTQAQVDPELIRFKPIIDNRETMNGLAEKLAKHETGITKSEIEAMNLVSTMELTSFTKTPMAYERAQSFLNKLEKAQSQGKVDLLESTLTSKEHDAMANAIKTLKKAREGYVPPHLQKIGNP